MNAGCQMILSKEQVSRYLRHIIIPEISDIGQKKIIESKIFVVAGDTKEASSLIYYLAASGVGSISCCFSDCDGCEILLKNVKDLNNECIIELIDKNAIENDIAWFRGKDFALRIFLSEKSKIKGFVSKPVYIEPISKTSPLIVAVYDGWKGSIQFLTSSEQLKKLYGHLKDIDQYDIIYKAGKDGNIFAAGLLGAAAAIEAIKYVLDIGSNCETPLYFNLLSMDFKRGYLENINEYFLSSKLERENTYLGHYKISKELKDCKVLIAGVGGLGSPAAMALAGAGVGTIGLVDYDFVEASNLNRQLLHSTSRIGMSKVDSAEKFINNIFNGTGIIKYNLALNKNNILEIINEYDVIIDGIDNLPARYLLNDACFFAGKPMIEAGAVRFEGLNTVILPGIGPCYRCLFPEMPDIGSLPGSAEAGVLGPVPGVIGFIEAAEAYKLLMGCGELLVNKIMYFDALNLNFDIMKVDKTTKCKLCGKSPIITKLQE